MILRNNVFIWNAYSRFRGTIANQRRKRLNKQYSKAIYKLEDPLVFQSRVDEILSKIREGKKLPVYLITSRNDRLGILGYVNLFLPHLAYSLAKGYIPVIDLASNPNIYSTDNDNSWEKFFTQPFDIGLDDLQGNKIIKCPVDFWYTYGPHCIPGMSEKEITFWNRVFMALVHYNERTELYLQEEYDGIIKNHKDVIGAIYRGTDYTQGHPIGHPIQPSKKMLADKIEESMATGDYEAIYIASDEKGIVDYLEKRFPNKVLINRRSYYDEDNTIDYSRCNIDHRGISDVRFQREDDAYLRGVEYLSSINLVSNCSALIAGGCGATIAALYMNGLKYKSSCVFQLGKYGKDPIPYEESN